MVLHVTVSFSLSIETRLGSIHRESERVAISLGSLELHLGRKREREGGGEINIILHTHPLKQSDKLKLEISQWYCTCTTCNNYYTS